MSDHTILEIHPTETIKIAIIDNLLFKEGIRRDPNLDYICAMFDSSKILSGLPTSTVSLSPIVIILSAIFCARSIS